MEKRPTSITVIGVLLLVFTLLGVVGLVMTATTAAMAEQVAKMHISLPMYQAYGALGIIINLVCVYGIFKGLPWSRVLYLVWGIIGLVAGRTRLRAYFVGAGDASLNSAACSG